MSEKGKEAGGEAGTVLVDEDVAGLQVAVHDSPGVKVREAAENLQREAPREVLLDGAARLARQRNGGREGRKGAGGERGRAGGRKRRREVAGASELHEHSTAAGLPSDGVYVQQEQQEA